jgi:hypothetical protein
VAIEDVALPLPSPPVPSPPVPALDVCIDPVVPISSVSTSTLTPAPTPTPTPTSTYLTDMTAMWAETTARISSLMEKSNTPLDSSPPPLSYQVVYHPPGVTAVDCGCQTDAVPSEAVNSCTDPKPLADEIQFFVVEDNLRTAAVADAHRIAAAERALVLSCANSQKLYSHCANLEETIAQRDRRVSSLMQRVEELRSQQEDTESRLVEVMSHRNLTQSIPAFFQTFAPPATPLPPNRFNDFNPADANPGADCVFNPNSNASFEFMLDGFAFD